jgi:hypothetical protein
MDRPSPSTERPARSSGALFLRAVYVLAVLLSWVGYLYVVGFSSAGKSGTLPDSLALAWLVFAPALTYFPIGRVLHSWVYTIVAIGSWIGLGYLLARTSPGMVQAPQTLLSYVFLIFLFLALWTLFASVSYWIGARCFPIRLRRWDRGRATREGAEGAIFIVIGALLHVLGVFNWLNAFLILGMLAAFEVIALSRGR